MSGIKIDIVSVPFSGHLLPLLTLVYPLLGDKRYQIRVFTGKEKIGLVESLGIEAVALLPDKPEVFENIANSGVANDVWGMIRQFHQSTSLLPEVTEELITAWKKDRPDIVLADFVSVAGGLACRELSIPWITTIPSPFAIESRSSTPSYLGGWKPYAGVFYRIRDAIGRQLVHAFKKTVYAIFRQNLGKYKKFELYDENGYERIYSPYSILGLGMKEMEFREDFPPHFRWAGYRCLSFEEVSTWKKPSADGKTKRVLLTCGNHLPWVKKDLIRIAVMLKKEYPQLEFLISLGMRSKKEKKPKQIEKNIWLYPYLPYHQVLPEVDYVVHHGGAGILYNCIEYAKPSVIIPRDYDQFDYAVRAELAGIAQVSKKSKEKTIKEAFHRMLNGENRIARKRMQRLWHTYQPTEILLEEINRIVSDSGRR